MFRIVLVSLLCLVPISLSQAQVTSIAPFTGDLFDNFNSLGPVGPGLVELDILGGFCTVRRLNTSGSLKLEFSSLRGGDQVWPMSAPIMFGQLSVSEWTFDTPLSRFGMYFENNSRFDDAVVQFFDDQNNLITTLNANISQTLQQWQWNGWEFATPMKKMTISGNDVAFLNGFIWYEDVRVSIAAVPEPTVLGYLGLLSAGTLASYGYYRYTLRRRSDGCL